MAAASGLRKRLRREEILRQDIDYKNPLTGCVVSRTQKRTSVRLPLLCADRLPIYRGSRLRRTQREGEGGGGCGKRENDCFARATDTRCRFSANPKSKKSTFNSREAEGEGYPQFCKTNRGSCFSSAYEIWSLRDSEEAKIDKQPLASGTVDAPEKLQRNVGKAQKHERPG